MAEKKVLILGAGLSGLSAAWHLQRRGINCLVFEKEEEAGGLCRSKTVNGFTFDYDGHLLHFRHRYTFELVKGLLDGNLREHKRSSWVYLQRRYTPYPFQANLRGLPAQIIKECLLGYLKAQRNTIHKNNGNFLSWINHTFGSGIAKYFMIPYNTKFWTLPPEELTSDWLDGFIPVPSLNQIIEGSVEDSRREFGYNARFWYPKKGGIRQLALVLIGQIKNIYTDCQITEINLVKKEIKINSGNKEKFDYLVSTIPLPELPYMIKGLPPAAKSAFSKLRWNSIFNLNLGIDKNVNCAKHWVYFPEGDICFFRVGFPHNFSDSVTPANKGSLYIEIAYSKDKPLTKDRVVLRIKKDLEKVGILSKGLRTLAQDINDIKYGYPIYDINYRKSREKILKFLTGSGIIPCGRYGSWRYMSMEEAMLDGKRAADILSGKIRL